MSAEIAALRHIVKYTGASQFCIKTGLKNPELIL